MSRRSILLLSASALLLGGAAWYLWPTHYITVQEIEEQLRVRTPVGASADQVLAVLDSMKAEHSDVSHGVISANFGKSFENPAVYGAVYGTFKVDSQGRLASYEVKQLFTGP
jgi:hypothetical protein